MAESQRVPDTTTRSCGVCRAMCMRCPCKNYRMEANRLDRGILCACMTGVVHEAARERPSHWMRWRSLSRGRLTVSSSKSSRATSAAFIRPDCSKDRPDPSLHFVATDNCNRRPHIALHMTAHGSPCPQLAKHPHYTNNPVLSEVAFYVTIPRVPFVWWVILAYDGRFSNQYAIS